MRTPHLQSLTPIILSSVNTVNRLVIHVWSLLCNKSAQCGVGNKQGKLHVTFDFTGSLPYKQSNVQGKLYDTFYKINKKYCIRGGEWYLEKPGSRKILAGSRNLGSVFEKSRSLIFSWFVFTFFESRNVSPKSLELRFLTRISVSRQVSDFTIRHPLH